MTLGPLPLNRRTVPVGGGPLRLPDLPETGVWPAVLTLVYPVCLIRSWSRKHPQGAVGQQERWDDFPRHRLVPESRVTYRSWQTYVRCLGELMVCETLLG